MPRPFTPKIITANDLLEGDVIYYTADNSWTREMSQAELIEDEAEAQLRLIEAEKDALRVVGIYLTDAKAGANGPEPTHFREDFRRTGPSNYRHGKQEAAANV
ncbi:DUF2849 domain-containing protein [Phaeobacter italicus]|jgi:exonuclease III|uniref:Sulfite reductase n=1 Tax=Phaeobacter italicus TaxID=481446 RepID=A0A0H5CXG7_9RHOB|nr:DUF2849 domain-containing protein [Phaeobacter italicus]EEB72737.1 conserved hypothetical protein [Ruegeria sp. R11]MEC8016101.1 DUF2849 domain-containing protein [Pseudomonadota bacterium]MBO9441442.1 DUF2849 domain-containing protein [Phaeobacter italicus]MBY5976881.1 DUF2849 domain-containing protein [Phaeobacter italicus]MBY6044520.1 DUF2849 domain-containing protein [Phaeobacter italicus]